MILDIRYITQDNDAGHVIKFYIQYPISHIKYKRQEFMTQKIYLYDGTFYGLLGLCLNLIKSGETPSDIVSEALEDKQEGLFDTKIFFETDMKLYEEMKAAIISKMGKTSFDGIAWAYLSENKRIEPDIFRYILFGFEKGRDADKHMTDDRFIPVYRAYRQVCMEAHRFKGFLRFEEIKPGIFYAGLEPDHNIIMMLASHFKRRLSGLNWIIHDKKRGTAVFYDTKTCALREAVSFELPDPSGSEADYSAMWASYFGAMGIKERKNYRLQRQLVPKKYRKHMTEFNKGA
jgi:probable DNA metabolism protein